MSSKPIKIQLEDEPEHNQSRSTVKKMGSKDPKGGFKRKVRDDVEYQDYLLTKFRIITKKCLEELRKEDFVVAFAKLDESSSFLTYRRQYSGSSSSGEHRGIL
jgi:hypothetical protein